MDSDVRQTQPQARFILAIYCPRSWAITYTYNTTQPALLQYVVKLMFCILNATSLI